MSDAPARSQSEGPAPVIFLDTNAVHYATLALSFAEKQGVNLLSGDPNALKAVMPDKGLRAGNSYVDGVWIVRYLGRKYAESAEFYYSPVTGLELLCGRLKAEAVKQAASIGVPNRWFSRMEEREVRDYLEPDGYTHVQAQRANVEALFYGVDITVSEMPADKDVWDLANALMENVFIDVEDALIYASALRAQASELITTDGFLRETADYVSNPRGAPTAFAQRFQTVRDALVNCCAQVRGWPPEAVLIPKAMGIKQIKGTIGGGQE